MHLAFRPYVTTGVALVGATVIAAAPMQPVVPADIQITNPAVQAVERGVQLTANEIQTAINNAIFTFVARPTVAGAELLGSLLEPLIGEDQALLLPLAALGFAGPLISGGGSIGTALQDLVDSDGLAELLFNLIGGPGTIIDGLVNGGYGPDLASLVGDLLASQFDPLPSPPFPPNTFPQVGTVFAGGLINLVVTERIISMLPPFVTVNFTLPGTIPTLQQLVEQLFGLLGGSDMSSASLLAAPPPPPQPIEDGVNRLTFALVSATVPLIARLLTPILGPLLPPSMLPPEVVVTGLLLGLSGPLISGPGAAGAAIQDVADSLGSRDPATIVNALIGAPATLLNGVVNGGLGPDLDPLVGNLSPLPVLAGGLINPGGLLFNPPSPIPVGVALPGTIPTLQQLVGGLLGSLTASNQTASTFKAPAGGQQDLKLSSDQGNLTLTENDGQAPKDGPEVTPKKHRQHFNLDVLNPLGNLGGAKKAEEKDASPLGSDNGTTAKHRPGLNKTPVGRLISRVLSGGHDHDDDDSSPQAEAPAE